MSFSCNPVTIYFIPSDVKSFVHPFAPHLGVSSQPPLCSYCSNNEHVISLCPGVFKTYCWIHGTFTLPAQLTGHQSKMASYLSQLKGMFLYKPVLGFSRTRSFRNIIINMVKGGYSESFGTKEYDIPGTIIDEVTLLLLSSLITTIFNMKFLILKICMFFLSNRTS